MKLGRLLFAAIVVSGALTPWAVAKTRAPDPTPVDVRTAARLPCTRLGLATGVMAFVGLVNEHRFAATRRVWLPRKRLPTPAFFSIRANTGDRARVHAEIGAQLPKAAREWVADGLSLVEAIHIDARPNARERANAGLALAWVRYPTDGAESVRLGRGKGVWDCERRRLAMWNGSETPVADEETARDIAAGQCGHRRGNTTLRRYGQTALLCGPLRRA